MSQHVAVLMGGLSSERSVSLRSGEACARALEEQGFTVSRVDVGRDVADVLWRLKPDVALNALHGPGGEDGSIQGLLEIMGVPYTHSGVLASALAANKEKAKMVLAAADVPVPAGKTVSRFEAAKAHVLPTPYVLKPVSEGSSYGVFIVKEGCSHPPQELLRPDWAYGEWMLAETFIAGRELTCAVMGERALGVTEIKSVSSDWYDFDSKYAPGGSIHELPAKIKENIYLKVQELALKAHKALGCRGISRTDFRYDDTPGGTGELVVLEVNTQPGMTETSLAPEMAAHSGMTFGGLVKWMVQDASCDR